MENNEEINENNNKENNENGENNKDKNKAILLNNTKYKIEIAKDNFMDDEIVFKIILIGDSAVGKTSLSLRLTENLFEDFRKATIGFDIFNYTAKINDVLIKLQIWDTCGLEEFASSTPSLYKNANLAIVVYAINDLKSFKNLDKWINLVKENASPNTLIFIVGNKSDLEKERKVQKEEGEKFKEDNNFHFFTESSAKKNEFVNELFQQAIIQLYEQDEEQKKGDIIKEDFARRKDSRKLNVTKQLEKKKKNCC